MRIKERLTAAVLVPLVMIFFLRECCVSVCACDPYEGARLRIREGFYAFEGNIDLSGFAIPRENLPVLLSEVIKDDPFLFYVDTQISYFYRSDGTVTSIRPDYTMISSDVGIARVYCQRRIDGMVLGACGSEGEKALYLHDLICRDFSYDETLGNDDLYSFLLNGSGTCQAYTALYTALLRRVGIEVHFAAGDAISHIWNLVKLDGEWYHVDVTWDDSSDGTISHRHFLLSDSTARERGHRDWYTVGELVCDSEKYRKGDLESLLHGAFARGDADHDGRVSLADLLLIRREDWEMICKRCLDMNDDGCLDDADAALVRMKILEEG